MGKKCEFNLENRGFGIRQAFPIFAYGKLYLDWLPLYLDAPRKTPMSRGGFRGRIIRYYRLWGALDQKAVEYCFFDPHHRFDIGGVIYRITCEVTGLMYYGISDNPDVRIDTHSKGKAGSTIRLYQHIEKYGWQNMAVEEVARLKCTRAHLLKIERALIKLDDTPWPNGLNMK